MRIFSLRLLLAVCLLVGLGTVGSSWAEAAGESVNISVEQWPGQSFTFLDLSSGEQAAGYEIFTVGDAARRGFNGDRSARLSYTGHVGKQVDVTSVEAFGAGGTQQEYMVYMTVSDTGEKLVGRTMRGQLEGLVLTADLNNARQQFLGQTVYPKYRELSGLNVPGNTMPEAVALPIGSPVTVIDVYTGYRSQEPIRLIVSVNGQKAVLPIAYSWTNIPTPSWTQTPPWQGALFTEDPRTTLGGSSSVWKQIEAGNVVEGMTKEQVHLSWGKPVRVKDNGSVWTYGTTQLNFNGDVLESMETVSE